MAIVNQQNVQVKNGSTWTKICPFPVGTIFFSTNSTSPATIYGGSWTALTDSRFLRPSGSWGTTGGSSTITVSNIPSHSHNYIENTRYCWNVSDTASAPAWGAWDGSHTTGYQTGKTGGGLLIGSLSALVMPGIVLHKYSPLFKGGE